jgi:RecB family endonuclease NucS
LSDIKLFTVTAAGATELPPASVQVEKSLQLLFEANLETLLGVRFLASEYSTGPVHGGRIDTLGLDEDGCPVIIEYKRAVNENVINQGLFYLDWLMDHRKDFQYLSFPMSIRPFALLHFGTIHLNNAQHAVYLHWATIA